MKRYLLLAIALLIGISVKAQDVSLPHKVENLTITDMNGNPATLPQFGKKNLIIFYVDPDCYLRSGTNKRLSYELEANGRAAGYAIRGFGVINTQDSKLPKSVVRSLARKRAAKRNVTILDDSQQLLKKQWGLGDCNGKFVIMIVSKEGELVYCAKDDLDEEGVKKLYEIISKYRY